MHGWRSRAPLHLSRWRCLGCSSLPTTGRQKIIPCPTLTQDTTVKGLRAIAPPRASPRHGHTRAASWTPTSLVQREPEKVARQKPANNLVERDSSLRRSLLNKVDPSTFNLAQPQDRRQSPCTPTQQRRHRAYTPSLADSKPFAKTVGGNRPRCATKNNQDTDCRGRSGLTHASRAHLLEWPVQ